MITGVVENSRAYELKVDIEKAQKTHDFQPFIAKNRPARNLNLTPWRLKLRQHLLTDKEIDPM